MVYVLEWMEKPEGKRYRWWTTVSDCYACDETDLDGAAEEWRVRRSRRGDAMTLDEARADVVAQTTEDKRVDAWQKIAWCGECGGQWYDQPVMCCGKMWEPI